jgi:hypothetical protein
VLPLPPGAKAPPLKGYTGYDGRWPTIGEIEEWVALRPPDSNLMLRVEHGVIGIDVDAYNSKTGGQTLKEAEARWGPLPSTFRSSARSEDKVIVGYRTTQCKGWSRTQSGQEAQRGPSSSPVSQ